jgi:acyl dehydratase
MKKIGDMYFEDYQLNEEFSSQERIISEEDIIEFARLTDDYNPIHLDPQYARNSIYEKRIAHGMLGLSVISGLAFSLGLSEKTTLAFRALEWKFREPIYIGDSIRAVFKVNKKRIITNQQGGLIIFKVRALNQSERLIQTGKWSLIIERRKFTPTKK